MSCHEKAINVIGNFLYEKNVDSEEADYEATKLMEKLHENGLMITDTPKWTAEDIEQIKAFQKRFASLFNKDEDDE